LKRLGLAFLGEPAVPKMIEAARRAESLGFESVWVAETRFARDGFVPAAAIAARTERILVSTGVVNVYTRNPVILAISYATLDELSGGRAIFGIGPGSPLVLEPQGHGFDRPLARLREYVEIGRRLISGEEVHYTGETVSVGGVKLEFVPVRNSIPVYLGVTGPRAMRMAGEISDGVLMNGFTSCSYVRRSVERIEAGARVAGRDASEIDLAIGLVTSVDDDADVARNRVRPLIAMYLARFPNIARETGYGEEYLERVRREVRERGLEAGGRLVPQEVVDDLAAAGTPGHVRDRIGEYRRAGIQCPVLFTVGPNLDETLEATVGA
jgi:5,10-methylenetetrahydromethanopterin reductase